MAAVPGSSGSSAPRIVVTKVEADKVSIKYNGKQYTVQIFQGTKNVTDRRTDWESVATKILECLQKLEEGSSDFSLASMKAADIELEGDVILSGSPSPAGAPLQETQIRQVTWTNAEGDKKTLDKSTVTRLAQSQIQEIGQILSKPSVSPVAPKPVAGAGPSASSGAPSSSPITPTPPPASLRPQLTPPLSSTSARRTASMETFKEMLEEARGDFEAEEKDPFEAIANQQSFPGEKPEQIPKRLRQDLQTYLSGKEALNPKNPFRYTDTDFKEILTFMRKISSGGTVGFNDLGNGLKLKETERLKELLESKDTPTKESDKKLILKAFGNHSLKDNVKYPPAFFKAISAILNTNNSLTGVSYKKEDQRTKIVVLEEKDGKYTISEQYPKDTPDRIPSNSVFLLKARDNYRTLPRQPVKKELEKANLLSAPHELFEPKSSRPADLARELHYDAGGGGNCGALALAAAELEQADTYYHTLSAWKSAIRERSVQMRQETMAYIWSNAEKFLKDEYFSQFVNAFAEDGETGIRSHITDSKIKKHLEELLAKGRVLTKEDKIWMIQLYAIIAANDGVWLDKPFFLAFALANDRQVAIIESKAPEGQQTILYSASEGPIDEKECLFIHYDGNGPKNIGNHFQPIFREHKELKTYIEASNKQREYIVSRNEFLTVLDAVEPKSSASREEITALQTKLKELKQKDPHGYLTLRSLVSDAVFEKFEGKGDNIASLIKGLKKGLDSAEEKAGVASSSKPAPLSVRITTQIQRRTDLEERIKCFEALSRHGGTIFPGYLAPTDKKTLQKNDRAGYLAFLELEKDSKLDTEMSPLDAAQYLETHLKNNPHLQVRADFFKAWTADSTKRTSEFSAALENLKQKDVAGYIAYSLMQTRPSNPEEWLNLLESHLGLKSLENLFKEMQNPSANHASIRELLTAAQTAHFNPAQWNKIY